MVRQLPVGVQTYSVKEAVRVDRPAAFARLADLGFGIVETFGTGRAADADPVKAATELRRDLDVAGLTAVSGHAVAPIDERADELLEAVNVLGLTHWIIGGPQQVAGFDNDVFTDIDDVRRFADALTGAARVTAAHGIRLGFHNHWREIERLPDGTRPYDVLVASVGPEVELEVDVYWTQAGGAEPTELIEQYVDRVRLLHLKDGAERLGKGELQCSVGGGRVDNGGAVRIAVQAEYGFLEIDQCAGDPFEVLAAGAAWLATEGLGTATSAHV